MSGVLVHEWIEPVGGGEKVLDALASRFPDAPIIAPWNDAPDRYGAGRVTETWLARTPVRRHKAAAIPFLVPTWRRLPALDADWMLCSSHLFAHHARLQGPARDVPKSVYAHSPARYIWEPGIDGRGSGAAARAAARPLRVLDRRRAQEAVRIAANSRFVAERIARCWDRESTVIYPPVDVARMPGDDAELAPTELALLEGLPRDFVLGASRLVPYKRVDVAIRAGAAVDLPVVISGDGPDRERLEAIAERTPGRVTFVGRPSDALLRALYRRAAVFAFAPIEDFGIMPVEAMAAGTPVLGNAIGGTSETVVDGVTGAHLRSSGDVDLREAVERALAADPAACRARAEEFDGAGFGDRIAEWMRIA